MGDKGSRKTKDALFTILTGALVFVALSLLFSRYDNQLHEQNTTFYGEF